MAKKPYYANKPAVSSKKIADTASINMTPRFSTLSNPTLAPKKPGYTPGLVQPKRLKESGHVKAHRIGKR